MTKHSNITKLVPRYADRLPNAEAAMNVLRREMYAWDYKELAAQVGVSYSCIMAIRSGRTAWPRPKTFFNLLDVLQLDLYIIPRGRN